MTVFFMSMAFLESAVVVYLRALYYPSGFDFPLVPMDASLVTTEVLREFATMIMLLAPAALVSRSALERFAWFCFGFGVWDLFYYVWLKVLLDWPSSLGTFDLLFLIPVPWVGPVWAPCLISIGLIVLALVILYGVSKRKSAPVDRMSISLMMVGALFMILAFVLDPLQNGFTADGLIVPMRSIAGSRVMVNGAGPYVPSGFPWPWFTLGGILAGLGLFRYLAKVISGR
jgi:hypothetical protein